MSGIEGPTGTILTGLISIDGVPVTHCGGECDSHMCGESCGRIESHPGDDYGHICGRCASMLGGRL